MGVELVSGSEAMTGECHKRGIKKAGFWSLSGGRLRRLPQPLTDLMLLQSKGNSAMFMQDLSLVSSTPIDVAEMASSSGLLGSTLVETVTGWKPAQDLYIGEKVQTLDGGLRRIVALNRREILPGEQVVTVRGGVLNNCSEFSLLPDQDILLDTIGLMTAPYVRLASRSLNHVVGVQYGLTEKREEIVTPYFETEEAIWAQSGILLLCPSIKEDEDPAFQRIHSEIADVFLRERQRQIF
jgi:hypothetical protein